jgi:predicted permease
MSGWRRWTRGLRALWRRREVEREMSDEMRFHLEMEARELAASGIPPEEARRRAAVAFGGVERYKEAARDGFALRWLGDLAADLRFGQRSLRRSPGLTAVAVLALGVGIGANAAVFTYIDAIAFRPLPVREPGSIVAIFGARDGDEELLGLSYADLQDLRRDTATFAGATAFTEGPVALGDGGAPAVVWAGHVDAGYFTLLGVRPAAGRMLRVDDLREPVVVLGDAIWRTRFAGDPGIVGRTIRVNGGVFTVVGVAPPEFLGTRLFTYAPALWLPVGMHERTIPRSGGLLENRAAARFSVVARLREGVSLERARAALDAAAQRLAEAHPDLHEGLRLRAVENRTPINTWLGTPERLRAIGRLAMAGTALVLLVACADVASLLLARMTSRRREVAVRLSLGASRERLVRQFLTESLLLAALGVVAAIPIAAVTVSLSERLTPPLDFVTAFRPVIDLRVVAFTAAISVLAALAFGLAPALQSSRTGLAGALRDGASGSSGSRSRLREALVVGQLTVSLVVLAAAGLFARSLENAWRMDPGFRADGAVVFTLDPQLGGEYDVERTTALYERLVDRLRAVPGVGSVSRASSLPLDGSSSSTIVFADGGAAAPEDGVRIDYNVVGLDYFASIGTPVLEGRDFALADSAGPVERVVVNEVLAARLWPGAPATGKRLRLGEPGGPAAEVIGVMKTAKYRQLGEAPRAAMTRTLLRHPRSRTTVVVRGDADPDVLYAAIRREVRALDPALPITGLKTLRDHISVSYSAAEGGATAAAMSGFLALLLAAAGLYGVVAYAVAQRTREIAIRVALGAGGGAVVRLVVGRGLRLALVGIALGLVAALGVTRLLGDVLYDVSPSDPLTLGGVALLLAGVALLASFVPARRATRIEPMRALRTE